MPTQRRTTASRPSSDSYHHGNLRQALLDHAVELARAGGPDAVVLRDVQRMAGVSNSAAYRHYADRDELLSAVADYALDRLAAAMREALEAVPSRGALSRRAMARLRATGQAYVDFALAEPGLFRTAFASESSISAPLSLGEGEPRDHPFRILRGCIDDLVATGILAAHRREGVDEAAWAAVHGLATLFLDGALSALNAAQKQMVTDRLLDAFGDGIR